MANESGLIAAMPSMLAGAGLASALTILPAYDESIRSESQSARLIALSDLYRIYLPSQMSYEIYSKLYLALLRSLQKKGTKLAVQQKNQNFEMVRGQESAGIMGGSDSFTIIGCSGIGKSSAVGRAIELIGAGGVIEVQRPYTKVIPCLTVQTPFDSSVKGLLLEILRKVDEQLDSRYYETAVRARATTDMLIGSVSQAALNHVGLLIVDEIQNVVNSKNGRALIGSLTQLINSSGISICMVGTLESEAFFEQAMQLARRSLGLKYDRLEYGQYFCDFCRTVFGYQYVQGKTEITPAIMEWLYEHSAGVISVVVSLIHDAQEIAILNGREKLDMEMLNEAYRKRMSLLHGYIEPVKAQRKQNRPVKQEVMIPDEIHEPDADEMVSLAELATTAKEQQRDIAELLRKHFPVEEVAV